MIKINYAEFYITNVCNFNCTNCNRFNNYYFSGQQLWDDYADIYKKWGELIDIPYICILGGEPTLNPTLLKWIDGIASLWKNSVINVTTNATLLNNVNGLYDTLMKYNGRVYLDIGLHNEKRRDEIDHKINQFLVAPVVKTTVSTDVNNLVWQDTYQSIKADSWPECETPADFYKLPKMIKEECEHEFGFSCDIFSKRFGSVNYVDNNNVRIKMYANDMFDTSALIRKDNKFTLHNSDPIKSHDVCYSKKCHHFIKGKLYKCGVVALLPEFYKQYHISMNSVDTELMNSYVPLNVNEDDTDMKHFINNLSNAIPQCKFCPETFSGTLINATTKKTRIKKKNP
jgi:organic radical activating enzyme